MRATAIYRLSEAATQGDGRGFGAGHVTLAITKSMTFVWVGPDLNNL